MSRSNTRVPHALSMAELADHLGVSVKTIQRSVAAGHLRAHRIGRLVRITEEDAVAFLAVHRR